MNFFIDTANVEEIRKAVAMGGVLAVSHGKVDIILPL